MSASKNTVTGVIDDFQDVWRECQLARRRQIEELSTDINDFLPILKAKIERLEELKKESINCQTDCSSAVTFARAIDLSVSGTRMILGGIKICSLFVPGLNVFTASAAAVATSMVISGSASVVATGTQAYEAYRLREIAGKFKTVLDNISQKSVALDMRMKRFRELDKVRRISALKIIAAAALRGVFDSVVEAQTLNIIKSSSNALANAEGIPEAVVNACYDILGELEEGIDTHKEIDDSFFQIVLDEKVFTYLAELATFEIGGQLLLNFCIDSCVGLPVQAIVFAYKCCDRAKYSKREIASLYIEKSINELTRILFMFKSLHKRITRPLIQREE